MIYNFMSFMLFNTLDFLTKPKNLIFDHGIYYVEIDDIKCMLYSQEDNGWWSFYAIISRKRISNND
jgi:hypothetical protein